MLQKLEKSTDSIDLHGLEERTTLVTGIIGSYVNVQEKNVVQILKIQIE